MVVKKNICFGTSLLNAVSHVMLCNVMLYITCPSLHDPVTVFHCINATLCLNPLLVFKNNS